LPSFMLRPPPISTLFPYTTLFRSRPHGAQRLRRDPRADRGRQPRHLQPRLHPQLRGLHHDVDHDDHDHHYFDHHHDAGDDHHDHHHLDDDVDHHHYHYHLDNDHDVDRHHDH